VENSGAVPATVSSKKVFNKYCHCSSVEGWEGVKDGTSQETCLKISKKEAFGNKS
jgi:hypothetical protein